VAPLSQGRTAAAECGLFTHKSVPVIFEPPCTSNYVIKGARGSIVGSGIMLQARRSRVRFPMR
jgi:hypothetical protein